MSTRNDNNQEVLDEIRSHYSYFTGKASDISRSLAFGGIAVIWIFKTTTDTKIMLPVALLAPLIWFVGGLALDLLQYIFGGLIWWAYYRIKERQHKKRRWSSDGNMNAPAVLPGIIHVFYWSKLVCVLVGYAYLLVYMWGKFF